MFEIKNYIIISQKFEVEKFLPANLPEWEICRFFQELQVRRRQIGRVLSLKWVKVALSWHVSLNYGVYQVCQEPGNLDLH